jgi:hypothetical protein
MQKELNLDQPAVLIRVNTALSIDELNNPESLFQYYEKVRGRWRINLSSVQDKTYAVVIHKGVIQIVFDILFWYNSGEALSWRSVNENSTILDKDISENRKEFIGNINKPLTNEYKNVDVSYLFEKGNSNPINYFIIED